jgi:hypothetical protein
VICELSVKIISLNLITGRLSGCGGKMARGGHEEKARYLTMRNLMNT